MSTNVTAEKASSMISMPAVLLVSAGQKNAALMTVPLLLIFFFSHNLQILRVKGVISVTPYTFTNHNFTNLEASLGEYIDHLTTLGMLKPPSKTTFLEIIGIPKSECKKKPAHRILENWVPGKHPRLEWQALQGQAPMFPLCSSTLINQSVNNDLKKMIMTVVTARPVFHNTW